MEPQPDSECSGIEDSPCHLFPSMPSFDSQNANYMDIVCQRIAALVVQQFGSLTKSNYIAPNILPSMEENETPDDHFQSSIGNRYPAHMGLQRKGVMEWHVCKNYNCRSFRADTFECQHFTEKRLLAPDMENNTMTDQLILRKAT